MLTQSTLEYRRSDEVVLCFHICSCIYNEHFFGPYCFWQLKFKGVPLIFLPYISVSFYNGSGWVAQVSSDAVS